MKTKLFSLIMFAFLVAGLFTACNSPSNISGEFKEENYIVSIDKTINFLDELNLEGINLNEISFLSSNEEIMTNQGEGTFKAKSSGEAYIFATSNSRVIAKTKVSVKYKFSSPKNIKVSEQGELVWDRSYVTIGNQTFYATEYNITYAKYNDDGSLGNAKLEPVQETRFTLGVGRFKVSVQALEDVDNNIDASKKVEKELNNGVVGLVQGARLEGSENFGEQTAKFSWNKSDEEGVVYDVYLEGFKLKENISDTFFEFDYSRFQGGSAIELIIEAKDGVGTKLSSKSEYILHKLETPNVVYKYSAMDGFLEWEGDENASSYILKVEGFDGSSNQYNIDSVSKIKEVLAGYIGAAYNIQVMAIGKNEGFYLNSNSTEEMTVAKIVQPEIEVEIIGKSAKITFDSNAYSKNYRISYGGKSIVYNTTLGFSQTLDLSSVTAGQYTIEVTALPNPDLSSQTGVGELAYGNIASQKVISSETISHEFYVLDELKEITHTITDNISTISFEEVEFANEYNLYINDNLISDPEIEIKDGVVYFTVGDLREIAPAGNGYTFKIDAGRIIDGKNVAVRTIRTKNLSILPVVSEAARQTNGLFAWNEVEGAIYSYEIYATNSNYEESSASLIISRTTAETKTEAVELGNYYTIKIYTNSADTNNYLDANFVDENAYFIQNFIATKRIDAPQVTFSDENDIYSLSIEGVEYGGKYQIYVDGTLDGDIIVSQPKEKYDYIIKNSFADAKKYNVAVVASCGSTYDQNLYLKSAERVLYITRLVGTEFSMDYAKDLFERTTNENMNFVQLENSQGVNVKLGQTTVLDKGYSLDLMDYAKFGNEFKIQAKYIAAEKTGNEYYLDSKPVEYNFKRAAAPSAIYFDSGIVKWTAGLSEFSHYEAVLSLINSNTQDYHTCFQISKEATEYDVQLYISGLAQSDPSFESAYRQAEKIQFELYAFNDGLSDGAYLLPSLKGVTTKGDTKLDIQSLSKVELSFNNNSQIVSWTEEAAGSTYDIYVDGVLAVEGHSSNSISLASLGEYDYLTAKAIKVQAFNSGYLDSVMSDEIFIEKIQIGNTLAISKTGSGYTATFAILEDNAFVGKVWVNGSFANVNYTKGSTFATFDFANFATKTDFKIVLKAKEPSLNHYYIDSDEVKFTVTNLANKTITITHYQTNVLNSNLIKDDNFEWNDFRQDFVGNSLQPIVYTVKVLNQGNEYDFVSETCTFNLEEIESLIKMQLVGEVKIIITASVEKDYVLTANEGGVFGYYGSVSSTEYITTKLDKPVISEVTVYEDSARASGIDKKRFAGLQLAIEDKWPDFEKMSFTVIWQYSIGGATEYAKHVFTDKTSENGYYYLVITPGAYIESIGKNFFLETPTTISVVARKDQVINSTPSELQVNRFAATTGSSIDDDGILTIADNQENASYFLELKISDKTIYKPIYASQLGSDKKVDLLTADFFAGIEASGNYQIKIIAFDENQQILPSATAEVLEGYQLAGINEIRVDENGNIVFSLAPGSYEGLIFSARKIVNANEIRKDFNAKSGSDGSNEFYVAMIDVLNLFKEEITITEGQYTFGFTVRKAGSINADWKEFSFNYKEGDVARVVRGRELEQDYILFEIGNGLIETSAFNIKVTGNFAEEVLVPDEETETYTIEIKNETREFYFIPSAILGYWVTDLNGNNGYFSAERGAEANLIYTSYYVISLREMLKDIAYGEVQICVSRIGKEENEYFQYNDAVFTLYKLGAVDQTEKEFYIENNVLSWKWTQQDQAENAFTPSAYYVYIEDLVKQTSSKILVSATSLDLNTFGLTAGDDYQISVVAINYNLNVIASNSTTPLSTIKYATPISLDVVDGKIVFNAEIFKTSDFMQDIINYFADSSPEMAYHTQVGYYIYNSPFYFAPQTLENSKMKIKFTAVGADGGATNVVYTVTVPTTTLFPELKINYAQSLYDEPGLNGQDSYVNLLRKYKTLVISNEATAAAYNVNSMINSIISSNLGIGDDALLIDDLARSLPAGDYLISVSQVGEKGHLQSDYSAAVRIYIAASPELSLQTETIDGKVYYTALVTPTMNMLGNSEDGYAKALANVYKMQLRYQPTNGTYLSSQIFDLIIAYSGDEWKLSYNGNDIPDAISSVEWTEAIPKFKINMNKLRSALQIVHNELSEEDWIEANKLISINIFTYSQDDGYVVNGKSAKYNVRYLDLPPENIKFLNGQFVVQANLNDTYEVFVRYKGPLQAETNFTKNFTNGEVAINFENSGLYEYVVLSLNGSISSSTMNIGSDAYLIQGIYKLNAPVLTTKNNNLNISYVSDDLRYMQLLKFSLANDISLKQAYANAEDAGYYFSSELTQTNNVVSYVVGSKDASGDTIYPSELMAEEFHAFLNGNSGEFSIGEIGESQKILGDVLLEFDGGRPILSSKTSSIEALMLPYLGGISLSNGDFLFDDRIIGINVVTDQNFTDRSGNIVYEIAVKYYGIDNSITDLSSFSGPMNAQGKPLMMLAEETHYSERLYGSEIFSIEQIVSSSFINSNYDYFIIGVALLGGLHSTQANPNAIRTIEGNYVLINLPVYYGPNTQYPSASYGQQVLRSQVLETPILTRTKAPYIVEGNGVLNGSINFAIDRALMYSEALGIRSRAVTGEEELIAQDTASRIRIYAEYTYEGRLIKEAVGGTISFSTSTESGRENDVYVSFLPNEGLFANVTSPIKFYITIHGRDSGNYYNPAITSVPLVIDEVYKLPKMEEKHFTIDLIENSTYLSFAKYFANVSIANDYSCYKIVVNYMDSEGEKQVEITSSSVIKRFELKDDITLLSIQVQDGQSTSTANPKKLIYSDIYTFATEKTEIFDGEGNPLLNLAWNSQTMRFEWNWIDGRTEEYEYFISMYISGIPESKVISTNYYMPENRGVILNGGFELRARKKEAGMETIYSFSDSLIYSGDEISFNLFSGGNGSLANPYLIRNELDFVNISKRNVPEKIFYFKLDSDVTLNIQDMFFRSGEPIISEFYGELDGNDYQLTVLTNTVGALSEQFDGSIVGNTSLKFSEYSSIFKTISKSAIVKNLYIDYKISYNKLDSSNIIFSPLAAYNYGSVENVHLISFAIESLVGSGENNVFVGGIVGVNYGLIANCSNSNTASLSYSMSQQVVLNFGYAGICAYNASKTNLVGTITNCVNQAERQVTVARNNNMVYLAGIALSNSGKISTSGNNANMTLAARGAGVTTMTGYFAGITISNNGTLEYLYNNGEFSHTYGTLNYGGIAYLLKGGIINSLVETVNGQPLIKSCESRPNSLGSHYATSDSGTHTFITTQELSAQRIDCGNGFDLVIMAKDNGFVASIQRK